MPDPFVFVDVPPDAPAQVDLPADERHHLEDVLRLDVGESLAVCDGRGRVWKATLAAPGTVELGGSPQRRPRRTPLMHVLQALPKGRKMDDIVRSLVELGVDTVTPVSAARCVRELSASKRERARSRWRAVARAAASQARRAWLPEIRPVAGVDDAAAALEGAGTAGFVPHPHAQTSLRAAIEVEVGPGTDAGREAPAGIAIAIGPEGGWTDAEVATWQAADLVAVSLGPSILRTEHAAFAVAAILSYVFKRLEDERAGD